jgi:transposase
LGLFPHLHYSGFFGRAPARNSASYFRGVALGNPLVFSNDEDGFKSLDRWIGDLLASNKLSQIIVGMEPTGHYWLSLAGWLK